MINEQIEPNASHDFDVISHETCSYEDPGKGLQVDVEKVVGKIFGNNQVRQILEYLFLFSTDISLNPKYSRPL